VVPLFWLSHRVFIVSEAPLINKKVQGERLFKCHHLDQSSWVTNQKQWFCFMGSCENQCLNMWTHFHTLWKCGWVLHPKYTGQSHFPLCLWTCSKNPMSVSVFFSDKFCHIFDWNVENSNKFSNFCGKFHQNLNIKELKQITLVKGSYYLLRNIWCPVKLIQLLKNSTLSLSLSLSLRNCCRQNDRLLCNNTSLRTGL
jgi:hypothetical protein